MARSNLAVLQLDRGDPKGAEATIRAALPGWERALGPEHPDVLHGRVTLANTLEQQGRLDESERELRAAIAGLVRSDAPDTPFLAACHTDLARVLELQRRMPAAQAEWRAAIEIMTRRFGADHPDLARARKGLAGNLRATGGDRREARALDAAADAVLEAEAAAGR
jgi:tetratricopeptide (TPR) repeat protein